MERRALLKNLGALFVAAIVNPSICISKEVAAPVNKTASTENQFKNTSLVEKFAIKQFMEALRHGGKVDHQLDEKGVFLSIPEKITIRRPIYLK